MKTNSTNSLKGSNIPFFNFSKESFKLVCDMLESDEMTVFMNALYDYIYEGIEPDFNTKVLRSVWNNVISVMERKAESYFNKVEANRENGKKGGRPKKNSDIQSNTDFDNINIPSEQENVSNGQEIGKYGQMTPNELKNHLQGIQDAWEKRVS